MNNKRPFITVLSSAAFLPLNAISPLNGRQRFLCVSSPLLISFLACLSAVLNLALPVAPLGAYEVAILKSANVTAYNQAVIGFKSSMPPDTVFVEYDLKGDPNMGRMYAGKIRASGADLVLAVGSKAATAARLEILDIPVIYSMVLHPAKYDLKAPNMVGVTTKPMIGQQLGTLRTIMPNLKRIGYLYDPNKTPLPAETMTQARQFGITFVERQVRSTEEVPPALRELLPDVDALWLLSDSTVLTEESFSFLLRAAFDRRIPVIGFDPEFSRRGALISFWIDPADIGREAASIAHTILIGGTASAAKSFVPRQRMALNLGTAEYLGIAIPPTVQSMADEVY
ncbi:MAG: ABC transporter substrate-binding protein [Nitrospira sp.]|nr:ABC transporter substrate-binding protein [Nitrospira sp.]